MGEIRPLHLEMGARDRNGLEIQREKRKNRSSESVRNGWLGCECSEHQLIRGSLRTAARRPLFAQWLVGVANALGEYLFLNSSSTLVDERRRISEIAQKAVEGIQALEQLRSTHIFSELRGTRFNFPDSALHELMGVKESIKDIAEGRMKDYYPLRRNDSTAAERVLISRLHLTHFMLFRSSKPEAIGRVLELPFILHKQDARTIERICSRRRDEIAKFLMNVDPAMVEAIEIELHDFQMNLNTYRQSNGKKQNNRRGSC